MLTRSSSRDCKMTFIIGLGFAECQILKKWNWPYLLNWVEYFDKLLRKHWYWQDLAQEIAKLHFSLVEALIFCIHIDIDKMYPMRLSNDIWDWMSFCRGPNSEKVKMALSLEQSGILWWNFAYTLVYWQDVDHEIVKWHLGLVEVLPRFKFWKKVKLNY